MVVANLKDNIDWFSTWSYDKNAENFYGHGKLDVAADAYTSNPLCLWITLPVMQVFSGRVLRGPLPDQTCN